MRRKSLTVDGKEQMPMEIFTYEVPAPDVNEQASQLAQMAKGLRAGEFEAHLMVPVETSQAVKADSKISWTLRGEDLEKLTDESRQALSEAGIDLIDKKDVPPAPPILHEKMMIFDGKASILGVDNWRSQSSDVDKDHWLVGDFNFPPRDWQAKTNIDLNRHFRDDWNMPGPK